ncbi:MAG: YigZ family protein [Oscillospiraceae bacterium]|nr:YigZ family protein [Oscillospiraceae bacterium]
MKGYLTIADKVTGEYEEKKSRFIAWAFPIESEEEALKRLSEIKKANVGARHNVFAYRLNGGIERQSDDGEPSGTGGRPLMDILSGADVYNAMIVVTRYFGGILLGTGGLKRAYIQAAADAFKKAQIIKQSEAYKSEIKIPYSFYDRAEILFREKGAVVAEKNFGEQIDITLITPAETDGELFAELKELLSGTEICSKKEEILYFFKK